VKFSGYPDDIRFATGFRGVGAAPIVFARRGKPYVFDYAGANYAQTRHALRHVFWDRTKTKPFSYHDGMSMYSAYFVPYRIDPLGLNLASVDPDRIERERKERQDRHRNRNRHNQCPEKEPTPGKPDSRENVWKEDNPKGERMFHGGLNCYRSGNFQCCYDCYGKLVDSGPFQGTYDYTPYDPETGDGKWPHLWDDVWPHLWDDDYGDNLSDVYDGRTEGEREAEEWLDSLPPEADTLFVISACAGALISCILRDGPITFSDYSFYAVIQVFSSGVVFTTVNVILAVKELCLPWSLLASNVIGIAASWMATDYLYIAMVSV